YRLRFLSIGLGLRALETEAKLARNSDREIGDVSAEILRRVVISHELSAHPASGGQRDEGKRAYAFRPYDGAQVSRQIGGVDVGDENRFGITIAFFPGGVAIDRPPICFGQPAPGDEPHHTV